jgi:hypothetical protein
MAADAAVQDVSSMPPPHHNSPHLQGLGHQVERRNAETLDLLAQETAEDGPRGLKCQCYLPP